MPKPTKPPHTPKPRRSPIFFFARARVVVKNYAGSPRATLELDVAELAGANADSRQRIWRAARAEAHRVLATLEERSVEEMWTPTLTNATCAQVEIHIEPMDAANKLELERALYQLRKAAAEVAP